MIKEGDLLVCKQDFVFNNYTYIIENRAYEIKEIHEDGIANALISDLWIIFTLEKYYTSYYIWDYFYNPAELRDKRIDEILND